MKCDYCGDNIKTDDEYWHFSNLDLNYHTDCLLSSEVMMKKTIHIKEADDD
jgi:hypothetical protein